MSTLIFSVPAMTCGHCQQAVTDEVIKISGVSAVEINLESKKVVVTSSGDISWSDIVDAVDEAGFAAIAE